jgi:pyruvate/2-oxoglutarate dehydrogenase complex dihydrolipoamide acyltransferase (E2) component
MRGRLALIPFVVVVVLVCAATVGFAASGGEPGRPDQPGKSEASPGSSQDSSKHDPSNPDGTYQGKSSSTPDQDGIGADHGIVNNDKTGPGTDGNNGCGNDPDREDDNNGWCGQKPANQTPVPSVSPTATATASVGAEVLGRTFTRPQVEVAGRQLARTGAPITDVFFAAMALLVLGASLRAIAGAKR